MQEQSLQEMIYQQMDHFLSKSVNQEGQIRLGEVMEIASWVSAFLIRQRHLQTENMTELEMQGILGAVGNFCHENFQEHFTQAEFDGVAAKTLELLQMTSFDEDAKSYFEKFYA
jgi:hypothetical protein